MDTLAGQIQDQRAIGEILASLFLAFGLAGLVLAAVVTPVLRQAFPTADPRDPLIYGVVAGVLALTAIAAALNPARRALGVDVVEALGTE